jgi:hypothetical protein
MHAHSSAHLQRQLRRIAHSTEPAGWRCGSGLAWAEAGCGRGCARCCWRHGPRRLSGAEGGAAQQPRRAVLHGRKHHAVLAVADAVAPGMRGRGARSNRARVRELLLQLRPELQLLVVGAPVLRQRQAAARLHTAQHLGAAGAGMEGARTCVCVCVRVCACVCVCACAHRACIGSDMHVCVAVAHKVWGTCQPSPSLQQPTLTLRCSCSGCCCCAARCPAAARSSTLAGIATRRRLRTSRRLATHVVEGVCRQVVSVASNANAWRRAAPR